MIDLRSEWGSVGATGASINIYYFPNPNLKSETRRSEGCGMSAVHPLAGTCIAFHVSCPWGVLGIAILFAPLSADKSPSLSEFLRVPINRTLHPPSSTYLCNENLHPSGAVRMHRKQ
ncbi:uncharacterized protein ZHAS_00007697 [Anopheles sinensis]|uniref:Uncharacterized protein n=1 Tax=Anopheles sinensis TaxID=74873 RepID=A0A084VQB5_ANOSI|nr:uncharacterized protein ZHAS_00007697 [Anopheles sinensis]